MRLHKLGDLFYILEATHHHMMASKTGAGKIWSNLIYMKIQFNIMTVMRHNVLYMYIMSVHSTEGF